MQMTPQAWGGAVEEGWPVASSDEWYDDGKIYSEGICKAALRGEELPTNDSGLLSHVTGLCVLRGIRHHHGFAAEVLQKSAGQDPAFPRALHARAIMSNEIPEISMVEEFPDCIWYPDTAAEETYRRLAKRYLNMRYQVGRACAVAGYKDLYLELDLIPDVSIAEAARGSVMRATPWRQRGRRQKWKSGDVRRNSPPAQALAGDGRPHEACEQVFPKHFTHSLNEETSVSSTLELRRDFRLLRLFVTRYMARLDTPSLIDNELATCYFNITED